MPFWLNTDLIERPEVSSVGGEACWLLLRLAGWSARHQTRGWIQLQRLDEVSARWCTRPQESIAQLTKAGLLIEGARDGEAGVQIDGEIVRFEDPYERDDVDDDDFEDPYDDDDDDDELAHDEDDD